MRKECGEVFPGLHYDPGAVDREQVIDATDWGQTSLYAVAKG